MAIRTCGDVGLGRGTLARRQRLSGVRARHLALLATVLMKRIHHFSASTVRACRSFCSLERMRVLMVPSG